jgi:WD40 repeat protein
MSEVENNAEENPEVYALKQGQKAWQFNRRDFLTVGSVTLATLAAGCSSEKLSPKSTPVSTFVPTPTLTPTPTPAPTFSPQDWTEACLSVAAHRERITAMAVSPTGSLLISGSEEPVVKIWSLPEGQLLKTLESEKSLVGSVAVSPDGAILAVSNWGIISLWALPDGTLLKSWQAHEYEIKCMLFSPDGGLLISGSVDKTIRLWSMPDGTPQAVIPNDDDVDSLAVSPDGSYLISTQQGNLGVWLLPEGKLVKQVTGFEYPIERIFMHPDGTRVITSPLGREIIVWSFPEWEPVQTIGGFGTALAISPDGACLLVLGESGQVQFWSFEAEKFNDSLAIRSKSTSEWAVFHPDGSLIAIGGVDGRITLWSYPEKQLLACPMDLVDTDKEIGGVIYEITNAAGETVSYTYPCGSTIPGGAVCTCNCVDGKRPKSANSGHYWYPD